MTDKRPDSDPRANGKLRACPTEKDPVDGLQALSSVPVAILVFQDDRWIYANRAAETLSGYSAGELIGQPFRDLFHPDDRSCLPGEEGAGRRDLRIVTKQGPPTWVDLTASSTLIGGRPAAILSAADITDRKRTEMALQDRESLYDILVGHSPDGIVIIDPATTGFIDFNETAHRQLGYSREEFAALRIFDIEAAETTAETRERIRKVILEGRADFDTLQRTRLGELRHVHVTAQSTNILGRQVYHCIWRDITERKRAEIERQAAVEALAKSESLLSTMTRAARDALVMMDPTGSISFWNPAASDIFGYGAEEALGRNLHELIAAAHFLEGHRAAFGRFKETGQGEATGRILELQARRKNGEEFPVELSLSPIRLENGWHAVGIVRDITARKRTEEALRESEKLYRTFINATSDMVFLKDETFRHIVVNRSLSAFFGKPEDELIGKSDFDLMPQETAERCRQTDQEALAGQSVVTSEEAIGDQVYETDKFPVDLGNDKTGLGGFIRNITARKKAEQALRQSEERYRKIFEGATEGIYQTTPEGRYLNVNPAFVRMFGYGSRQEMLEAISDIGQQLYVSPRDREEMMARLREQGQVEGYEVEVYRKDGSRFWISINMHAVRDASGKILYLEGTNEDITQSRQAKDALKESERLLADIINFLPDATMVIDRTGKVIAWNRAMEALTGVKREDMVGKGDHEYAIPFYGTKRPILIDAALHPEMDIRDRYQVFQRTGDVLFGETFAPGVQQGDSSMSATASVLRDSRGDIVGAIECIRDNTGRKRLEERLTRAEKMEGLGRLAGGVAHDLNNILGVLVGYSELLGASLPQGSPLKEHADNILRAGLRGAAIIQDLLTLARRGVAVSEVVDLNGIVSDYLKTPEFEKLMWEHPEVHIRMDLTEGLLNIKGSPIHLSKTLANLVSNAAEAIYGQGEIVIGTQNRYLDIPIQGYDQIREGEYAVLTVTDTGKGISEQDMGKIFEPFFTKKVMGTSGTGLGLAVVWGTVKDHDGYIDVRSVKGQGSTFTLYLPVTREQGPKGAKAVDFSSYTGRGETILVVDDVKEQRDLAVSMLQKLGYEVEAVSGGQEAVDYIRRRGVDLILLDMIMDPGIDGFETYRRILQIHPGQKAIMVSGFSETDRVGKARDMGLGAFVAKPYVLEKIGMAVRSELDRI